MSDYGQLTYNIVAVNRSLLVEMDNWLKGYLLETLANNTKYLNDGIEMATEAINYNTVQVGERISAQNARIQISIDDTKNLATEIDRNVRDIMMPQLVRIENGTFALDEKVSKLAVDVNLIPGQITAEINSSMNTGFRQLSESIDQLATIMISIINRQTDLIVATMTAGDNMLAEAVRAQTMAVTTQINTFATVLSTTLRESSAESNKLLGVLTVTIDTHLTALAESQVDFQTVLIEFLTTFWDMYATTTRSLRQIDYDTFDTARIEASDLTAQLPDTPLDMPEVASRDIDDTLEKYEQERAAIMTESV